MKRDIKYQIKAVNELLLHTRNILKEETSFNTIILKAPTGAGKTEISILYMEKILNKHKDACIFWLTPGSGDLHDQSYIRIKDYFSNKNVLLVQTNPYNYSECAYLDDKSIIVVNWEKINNKDDKTGCFTNNQMLIDIENKKNFYYGIKALKQTSRKIIVIIDECHKNCSSKRGQEILELLKPDVILKMSATPKEEDMAKYPSHIIDPLQVVNEGMIKKNIIINQNITCLDDKSYIEMSINKQNEIYKEYQKLAKNKYNEINNIEVPLILMQVPNTKNGEKKITLIKEYLTNKGFKPENIAIWLSNDYKNVDEINKPNSEVKVVIFKTAIATGWNCPRAHILVVFRDSSSDAFQQQILGRILRTPYKKHFNNEIVDNAYVYSPLTSGESKIAITSPYNNIYSPEYVSIKKEFVQQKDFVKNKKLITYYKEKSENNMSKTLTSFINTFQYEFNKFLINNKIDIKDMESLLVTNSLFYSETETIKVINSKEITSTNSKTESVYSYLDIISRFRELVENCIPNYIETNNMFDDIQKKIYESFALVYNIDTLEALRYENQIKRFLISDLYKDIFLNIIINCFELEKPHNNFDIKSKLFELADTLHYNAEIYKEDYSWMYRKYLYNKCFLLNKYSTEKKFETLCIYPLEADSNLYWWFKQKDSGATCLSLNIGKQLFNPDYILRYKDNILIFEIKDDKDNSIETNKKLKELHNYLKQNSNMNVYGGIVIYKNNTLLISTSAGCSMDSNNQISGLWITTTEFFNKIK